MSQESLKWKSHVVVPPMHKRPVQCFISYWFSMLIYTLTPGSKAPPLYIQSTALSPFRTGLRAFKSFSYKGRGWSSFLKMAGVFYNI